MRVLPSDVAETSRLEFLGAPPAWVTVLVVVPAVLLFAWWAYRGERLAGRLSWLPPVLRGLVVALVVLFLFHPVRSTQRVRVERPTAAVLLDDSASLRERDLHDLAGKLGLPSDATRQQVVAKALEQPLAELSERYEVLVYAFGESLRAIGGLSDLRASDGETRLGDALANLAAETRGRELAQVVVVSDGRVNAGRDTIAALAALSARRVPVNALGVGDPQVPRDVRIQHVTAPEVALAGDTVTLEVAVGARGYPGQASHVVVRDAGSGLELARTEFELAAGEGATEQMVRVAFVPDAEGELELQVAVREMPGERDVSNNVDRRVVRVEPGRIKVLYIDGYPRYEYRFLKDSLLRVENVQVQVLLLSASGDFIQESTAGVPPLKSVPWTLDWLLENYHVIILGDVLPGDLGPQHEQFLANVKAFVEAGGGFLMQAGTRYSPRDYVGTPIEDILPVLIGDRETELRSVHDPGAPFRPRLARPRDPHEIVTLLPDVEANRALWEDESGLAPLTWYYPVAKARATAEVVLQHPTSRNAHGPHVLLATMYHPQGRTAFLATDETWRWRFRYLEAYREPFWRGLIRYLALNKLRRSDFRFDLSTELSSYAIGERIAVTARVLDAQFEPWRAESFDVVVVSPDGRRETVALPREGDGRYRGSLLATEPGPWRLWLEDPESATSEPHSPRIVTVTVPSLETDDPVLDETLLQRLAARSGGLYDHLSGAPRLLASFDDATRERPLDEPEREEVWAGFPQLLLLVGLLSAEWLLRKRKNLV